MFGLLCQTKSLSLNISGGRVASRILAEPRRERRAYPQWYVRSEQRRDRPKFVATLRAEVFLPSGGVAHLSRSTSVMRLPSAEPRLLARRQKSCQRACLLFRDKL